MASATHEIDEESYEDTHVHQVYEQIAPHFSSTRFKPWPLVENFLKDLPDGSIGLDVGCGNGKYLTVNKKVFIIGSDRSRNLAKIAAEHQPQEAIVADNLHLPHSASFFDFAISIAVIHHLSTTERRVEAIRAVLETLRPAGSDHAGGEALFYVWALEQKTSRRGWDEGGEQDVMVPWVMKASQASSDMQQAQAEDARTFNRYYHLYRQGELEDNIQKAGGTVIKSGYERDNWWAIATGTT